MNPQTVALSKVIVASQLHGGGGGRDSIAALRSGSSTWV